MFSPALRSGGALYLNAGSKAEYQSYEIYLRLFRLRHGLNLNLYTCFFLTVFGFHLKERPLRRVQVIRRFATSC